MLPIVVLFLIASTIIGMNINTQPVKQAPADRPPYLISSNQIPKSWHFDLEMYVKNRYFLQIKTNIPKAFSIETIQFDNSSAAKKFDVASMRELNSSGLTVNFYQNSPKVKLLGVDSGYNWEVKSPCCFSRGVSFTIGKYYFYIFGSQESKWDDIQLLFKAQASTMLKYLGESVPAGLQPTSTFTTIFVGYAILAVVVIVVASTFLYQRYRKHEI